MRRYQFLSFVHVKGTYAQSSRSWSVAEYIVESSWFNAANTIKMDEVVSVAISSSFLQP